MILMIHIITIIAFADVITPLYKFSKKKNKMILILKWGVLENNKMATDIYQQSKPKYTKKYWGNVLKCVRHFNLNSLEDIDIANKDNEGKWG